MNDPDIGHGIGHGGGGGGGGGGTGGGTGAGGSRLFHHPPFSIPAKGRPKNKERHKHWSETCQPRVPKPSKRKKRSTAAVDSEEEEVTEAQVQKNLNVLVDNNILDHLRSAGKVRVNAGGLFEAVEASVLSVLANEPTMVPFYTHCGAWASDSTIELRCQYLVNNDDIRKLASKYMYNFDRLE
jgi:hypothetical protein